MAVVSTDGLGNADIGANQLIDSARRNARRRYLRPRLAVLGSSMADVVEHAGGFVFDRVMAGWDVTVLVPGSTNHRATRILGSGFLNLDLALTREMRYAMSATAGDPWPHAIALSRYLYESEPRIRIGLGQQTIERGLNKVLLWGNRSEYERHRGDSIDHRLSIAALVFKAQALSAAKSMPTEDVGRIETFIEQPPAAHAFAPDLAPAT
ncbi:hypothetical protein [Nocardia sp. 348MFTsu5.1]|uniref:hypothetical protein n=1 Tax=Nocardia sp. 348MFTsu5.1 TaxID=1172185 RepID=UPI00035E78A7|nr:hypothetical protein [Nocardia sp. 348MFTsu5.1]